MNLKDALGRRLVKAGLRLTFKLPSGLPLPLTAMRAGLEGSSHLFRPNPSVGIHATHLGGVPCLCLQPPRPKATVLLHFHGGAFFAGSANTHRALGSEFAVRGDATVYLVDYRRAPEHAYPAALDDAFACYQALLADGHAPGNILLGGDSGGCAHILALVLRLRDAKLPLPAGLIMISPFLDLTLSNPSVKALAKRDPMVTMKALQRGGDAYRGQIDAGDPRVSPCFADLSGLPPMLIQVGSEEILLDDAVRFSTRLHAAGGVVECDVMPGLWHNAAMFGALVPSADAALDRIGQFMRQRHS